MKPKPDLVLRKVFDAASALLEQAAGNAEFARAVWIDVFQTVERIEHNQSLGGPDELDRAVAEQADRFDQAEAARQKFHIVEDD